MAKLRVTMPDGSKWDVDTHYISSHRANFFASQKTGKTHGKEYDQTYNEEYRLTINNPDEIIDWASNSIDWNEIVDCAIVAIPAPEMDYTLGWMNGEKEIIS